MSRAFTNENAAMRAQRCPKCMAQVGERCRSQDGALMPAYMHVARWYAAVRERKAAAAGGTS